ncbi:MAG: CDP-alcohol phosphatidyltransferase family protein [Actinomycetota bacterium]|jgi:CDP-diacylglycerol--glycerol-3-phosphate 3-phosphatidyltransferase
MPADPSDVATWANLVTVGRLLIAPLVFWMIPDGRQGSWPAFLLWFVLCASDGIDGWLARRHGTTTLGTFLDPLADKVLILGAMFTLVTRNIYWIVPVVVIAVREIVISMYRTYVATKGVSVPASKLAKYKTVTQQLSVGFAIAPLTSMDAKWLWNGLLWVSVALALISGAQYLWRGQSMQPTGPPVTVPLSGLSEPD